MSSSEKRRSSSKGKGTSSSSALKSGTVPSTSGASGAPPTPPATPAGWEQQRELDYTRAYCEENTWKLLERVQKRGKSGETPVAPGGPVGEGAAMNHWWAIFVSNGVASVPFEKHDADGRTVFWDYHVFCYNSFSGQVWDHDARVDFPTKLSEYSDKVLVLGRKFAPKFLKLFRVIPAESYLKSFSSDRSDMRTPDGGWYALPPKWPTIEVEGGTDVKTLKVITATGPDSDARAGVVYDVDGFKQWVNDLMKENSDNL